MGEYTHNGVIGRPFLASAEKGKAVLSSLVDRFASVLEILPRTVNPRQIRERVPDYTDGSAGVLLPYQAWHSTSKLS